MKNSVLKQQLMRSPLANQSVIKPKGAVIKKSLVSSLVLTSLVDAFSILVIYLLLNNSASQQTLEIEKNMQLPVAGHSQSLDSGVVVKINKGNYFVDGEKISKKQLAQRLYDIIQQHKLDKPDSTLSVVIQADKHTDFAQLNPILLSSAQSGFEKLKFAVMQEQGAE